MVKNDKNMVKNGFTTSNVTAPEPAKPTDLLGIRDSINQKYGVQGYQDTVLDTQSKLNNVNIDVNDAISMSKLVGQRGKATEALNNQLQSQAALLSAAQNQANEEFGYAQDERNKIENLMLTAPGAGISYADSFESAVGKYNSYLEDEQEKAEERAKKAAKDGKYDALFAAYGVTASDRPKGMSKKEYLKKLRKEYGDVATSSSGYNQRATGWSKGSNVPSKTDEENAMRMAVIDMAINGDSDEQIINNMFDLGMAISPGQISYILDDKDGNRIIGNSIKASEDDTQTDDTPGMFQNFFNNLWGKKLNE